MDTKFIEAGNGGNWGKFLIGRYDGRELVTRAQLPGCEIEPRPLVSLRGPGQDLIWVLDLATGEGAAYNISHVRAFDAPRLLHEKHRIHVCLLYEPLLTWLFEFIDQHFDTWWDTLPPYVIFDAPGGLYGYRRAGATLECCGPEWVRDPAPAASEPAAA